jgi:hypothetical protein
VTNFLEDGVQRGAEPEPEAAEVGRSGGDYVRETPLRADVRQPVPPSMGFASVWGI